MSLILSFKLEHINKKTQLGTYRRKSRCQRLNEDVSSLFIRRNVRCAYSSAENLFLYKMTIDLKVFGPLMEDWILIYVNDSLIITKHR